MTTSRKAGQIALSIGVFVLFAATLAAFVRPILTGLLFALVLGPFMRRRLVGQRVLGVRLGGRQSAALTTTGFCLFILLPLTAIVIMLVRDGAELVAAGKDMVSTQGNLNALVDRVADWLPFRVPRAQIVEKGGMLVQEVATFLLKAAGGLAGTLPIVLFELALLVLTLYYGLADGHLLIAKIRSLLPFGEVTNDRILETANQTVRGGFLGAVLSAAAQSVVLWLGYLILGVPNSSLAGMGTFFTSFVPILGAMPAGFAGFLYLLVEGSVVKAFIMLAFFGFAGTVDNIIKPIVLKDSVDLHPMLGLLSALGGLGLLGFIGIFVGPMVTALALELINIFEERETQVSA